ncbi:hypothetical protein EKO23_00370 [Nocardioides guangzhouensis]|uniref:Uncharacterized protein n=1 Tax=Nocardioides guangzhouensis TaxID=2497878 RepID=A0A4Q4ZKP6_9ACTN|nr:hypothetical protein [Nocardioides guangzhouensis]RYP88930.1 hypothetical protein EKO23_00370 [Nocardioides guangzhouensis]
MSRTTSTLSLAAAATTLATLVTACGTGTADSEPVTRSESVADAAKRYAGDPWEQRFLHIYFSDRAMSDVWQRHPELLQQQSDPTVRGRPLARPEVGLHATNPYRQDPRTSAEAWTRRLEAVQGSGD